MKILALLDPFEGYNFKKDTSHLLLLEAQQRGHEIYYGELASLVWQTSLHIQATKVKILPAPPFFKFQGMASEKIANFDLVLIRKDPPVDHTYLHALQLLSRVTSPPRILNHPAALLKFNEKLIILNFPQWIPKTLVTQVAIQNFWRVTGGKLVLKPLDGFAGKGIQLIEDLNGIPPLEQPVMVQEFLPGIVNGEKRVFFLEGEVLGALLKVPAPGNFLANPDLGATLRRTELTPNEQQLAKELGSFFKEHGLFFAGVDLIDEKLTEINITSPGLLWELNELYGKNFEKTIVDYW